MMCQYYTWLSIWKIADNVYLQMPFGLTGAPATFCEMVSITLEDLIGRELVNWMDNICLPGDEFEPKLANIEKFSTWCRDRGLSIPPAKTKLFFTEVLFSGCMVGPDGIKPNLEKFAAVARWPAPQDIQDPMVFLRLTIYSHRLICNYTRITQPLTDLTRNIEVDIPKFASGKQGKGLTSKPSNARLSKANGEMHSRRLLSP